MLLTGTLSKQNVGHTTVTCISNQTTLINARTDGDEVFGRRCVKILKFQSANTLFYAQNIHYLFCFVYMLYICDVAFCRFSSHACIALYLIEVLKEK